MTFRYVNDPSLTALTEEVYKRVKSARIDSMTVSKDHLLFAWTSIMYAISNGVVTAE